MRNENDVTTPKLPPPPRIAQKRSGSRSASVETTEPSARTTVAATRLSIVSPNARVRCPRPPPSVRPPTPVVEITPAGTAPPCSCVAVSTWPSSRAALDADHARRGIDRDLVHHREVDDEAVVDAPEAAAVVPAAADGEAKPSFPRERDCGGDVLLVDAVRDRRRSLVDHRVVERASLVVAGRTGLDDASAHRRGEPFNCSCGHAGLLV